MTGKMTPKEMEELTQKILAGGDPGAQPAPGKDVSSKGTVFEPVEKYFETHGIDEPVNIEDPGEDVSSDGTVFEPVEKYFETHGIEDSGGAEAEDKGVPPVESKQEPAKPPETKQNPPPDDVDDPAGPEKQLEQKGDGPLPAQDDEEVTNEDYLPEDAEAPPEAYEEIQPQKVDVESMESKSVPDKAWGKGDIEYGPEKADGANEPGAVPADVASSTGSGVTDPASEPYDTHESQEKQKTPWGKGDVDFGPDHEELVESAKGDLPPNFGSTTGPGVTQPGSQAQGGGGGSFFQDLGAIGLGGGMAGGGGDGPASGGFGNDKLKDKLNDLLQGIPDLPDPTKPDF